MKAKDVVAALRALIVQRNRPQAGHVLRRIAAGERGSGRYQVARSFDELAEQLKQPADLQALNLSHRAASKLHVSRPEIDFPALVLPPATRAELVEVVKERSHREALHRFGLSPRRRLLLHGPPGCGKTSTAGLLASKLELPLLTVRLSEIIDSHMGATDSSLGAIFEEMDRTPGVYLLDEMETLTRHRGGGPGTASDRAFHSITTTLLQLLDHQDSDSLLIGATNRLDMIDPAVRRRFDSHVEFPAPGPLALAAAVQERFILGGLTAFDAAEFGTLAHGLRASFSDAHRAVDHALRRMVLAGRDALGLPEAVESLRSTMGAGATEGEVA